MSEKGLNKKFWAAMLVFGLMGQIAWVVENMYFNVFIYKMFNASAADISSMVMASAVMAALTTIIMGAVSDKVGKRKAFMSAGYIIWGISIISFAYIKSVSMTIVMDCVMTFFGSTANDAAYNAWLTDRTDETNRGVAEGINSMMPLIAILVVFGGFMGFDLGKAESWTTIYLVIGIVVLAVGVLGFAIVEDAPAKRPDELGYMQTILYGFRPSVIKTNKRLYYTLIGFVIFGISIQVFMPYLIIYYEKTLGMSDYVLIMAPAIILAAVVTVIYGKLIDKHGFKKMIYPSMGMLALGYVLLFVFPGIIKTQGLAMKVPVFIGSLLMMSGYLSGMAVFGTKIRNDTPEHMAGRFQGLRIIAQVLIPGVIGPAIGAAVLKNAETITNSDGTTSFLPSNMIFLTALVVLVVLAIFITAVKSRLSKEA